MLKSQNSHDSCCIQIEWIEKKQKIIQLTESTASFFANSLRIWSRLQASVGIRKKQWCTHVYISGKHSLNLHLLKRYFKNKMSDLFCFILPVVNTIYYFSERRACRAASYWQVNCRVLQQLCLFLCFLSTHLLELSEALSVMWLVWYATS